MKILRVFGVVVGIHVFAFLFLLANPGCSSASKPTPTAADTAAKTDPSPSITVPMGAAASSPLAAAPVAGDASTPTVTVNVPGLGASRYSPTRPGTPAASALDAQPVADVVPATTYTVVSGDNLTVVAKKNKVTIAELVAANNLKPASSLRPGQKLIIISKPAPVVVAGTATTKPAGDVAAATTEAIKHTVKSGETLGAIARMYHVTLGELSVKNNITDPKKIRPGQDLIIPPPSAKAKTSTSAATVGPRPNSSGSGAATKSATQTPAPAAEASASPIIPADIPVIRVDENPAARKP